MDVAYVPSLEFHFGVLLSKKKKFLCILAIYLDDDVFLGLKKQTRIS